MKPKLVAWLSSALLLAVLPVFGHHAFAAEFDRDQPVSVTGTVSKVEWSNPHIWFYVDVKDEDGKVTTWGFSGAPPGMLIRRGMNKNTLKVGDVIKVEGFRAKDNSTNASGNSVTFADGRKVFTFAAEANTPEAKK
jgi:hypothetical protein